MATPQEIKASRKMLGKVLSIGEAYLIAVAAAIFSEASGNRKLRKQGSEDLDNARNDLLDLLEEAGQFKDD